MKKAGRPLCLPSYSPCNVIYDTSILSVNTACKKMTFLSVQEKYPGLQTNKRCLATYFVRGTVFTSTKHEDILWNQL